MNKGGIIIRLIDIAMIILFGFIAISDIKVSAQIKLPSQEEEPRNEKEEQPAFVFVRVDPERGYIVEENEKTIAVTTETAALESVLIDLANQHRAGGGKMVVLIEPDGDSIIQQTVDVLDVCERNGIPMNINYESMQF